MNIQALFARFRRETDDLPAAILTLASVLAREADETPLTVKEAAERLNVSADTIYSLCEAGRLKHQRVGSGRGTIRIRPADLQRVA